MGLNQSKKHAAPCLFHNVVNSVFRSHACRANCPLLYRRMIGMAPADQFALAKAAGRDLTK